ncbi:uncharacterized protein [Branchiostoma lanceolatum]|uniref:uncharacterized protein n=1 Tax=Branchiostoma lanceolatum TaxID=7740 RepID=UPI0034534935
MRVQLAIAGITCCLLIVAGSASSQYISLGCWQDTAENTAIPTLEGTDPRLDGRFIVRENPIEKCYEVALSFGFTMFAVRNGGACTGSADGLNTYQKNGPSSDCRADGKGGFWANEVYQIGPADTKEDGWLIPNSSWAVDTGEWLVRNSSWVVDTTTILDAAAQALDGNTETYWNPGGIGLDNLNKDWYMILDLTLPHTLTDIAVNNYGDTTHDIAAFTLQKSKVGSPYYWEDVVSVTNVQGGTDQRQEFGGFQGTARYWKFVVNRTHSGNPPWLRELNLFGIPLECVRIPEVFELDGRLTMLPNLIGQKTFNEIQNSPVMDFLSSSFIFTGEHHPEFREFLSTVIFPRCNVSEEDISNCPIRPSSNITASCVGTQLLPCRSWCEEVFSMSDDLTKSLLPPCELFPSSQQGCWNPEPATIMDRGACYHGTGINYRGLWSTTTSGAKCLEWSAPEADYYTTEYPWANLDRNYCRNPTGLERPFCLTEDGSQEECDVIPCNFVGCWDRGPPNYGVTTPRKRFYFIGEKVKYTCNDGYRLEYGSQGESQCHQGSSIGLWEYLKPVCSVNYKERLEKDLLEIYSPRLEPETVTISFTGNVDQIVDLDEKKEQLVASVVINFTWYDSRLIWKKNYYGLIETISVPGKDIWTPTLNLRRNANPLHQGLSKDVPVRVSSSGLVEWRVETLTTTVCDADPFFFPADTMDCDICFAANSAIEQNIQCHGRSSTSDVHVDRHPCDSYSLATNEGEWYRRDKIFAKGKREACFSLQLSRIPTFHIATTVGPCIILVVLMTITFIMPIDKGDRISYGVTIQLSMVVSLVFVTEVLPVKGALPFFATLIIVCMGLMGIFLFVTLAVIFIHDKEGRLSPTARTVLLRYMARVLLLGDLTEENQPCNGASEASLTNHPVVGLTKVNIDDGRGDMTADDDKSVTENETGMAAVEDSVTNHTVVELTKLTIATDDGDMTADDDKSVTEKETGMAAVEDSVTNHTVVELTKVTIATDDGDMTADDEKSVAENEMCTAAGEDPLTIHPAIKLTKIDDDDIAKDENDMTADDVKKTAEICFHASGGDPEMTRQSSGSPKGLESTGSTPESPKGSTGFLRLISSVDELTKAVKRGNEELTNAVKSGTTRIIGGLAEVKNETERLTERLTEGMNELKNEMEEMTKAVKNEKEVSDFTLLAKVLDRLCLALYVIGIAAAIPITMYLGK